MKGTRKGLQGHEAMAEKSGKTCSDCANDCNKGFHHCYEKLEQGKQEYAAAAHLCVDCGHNGYDPVFAHDRWRHRQDRDWEHRVEANFQQRRDHEESRPPRTLAAQKELIVSGKSKDKSHVVGTPLDQVVKSKDSPTRFQPVNKDEQQKLAKHGQEMQKIREERQKVEAKVAIKPAEAPAKQSEPARVKIPKSPIRGKPADQLGKDQAPPQRHEAPKPDPKVEPKPRGESKAKTGGESGDKRKK